MLREQVLQTWSNLKNHLLKFKPVQENKSLIIEALEFHSNFASSFLTEHSNPELLNTRSRIGSLAAEIAGFNREIEKIHLEKPPAGITKAERLNWLKQKEETLEIINKSKSERENILTNLNNLLKPNNPMIQAFAKQKEKNERLVKECKELLVKLRE